MRCMLLVRRVGSPGLSASHGELHPPSLHRALLPRLAGWVGRSWASPTLLDSAPTAPPHPQPSSWGLPSGFAGLSVSLCTWAGLAATSAHTLNGNEKFPDGEKRFRGAAGVGVRSRKVWV